MPDPKSLAQAIAGDLQAIGFTVALKTERGLARRLRQPCHGGNFPVPPRLDLRLGRRRQFPYTAWFGWQNGKPNLQFGWGNPRSIR